MKQKFSSILLVAVIGVLIFALSLFCWFKPAKEYSDSERRVLNKFPELSFETLLSGEFMADFEGYTLDQFPVRDSFRTIKVFSELNLFGKKDSNDIYIEDGYVSKLEVPLNEAMVENAGEKFIGICDKYIAGTSSKVYLSIVPDKNYFLAEKNGYPHMDYERLTGIMLEQTGGYMEYVDIFGLLSVEDYYRTDTHWKQEKILDVAETLTNAMGAELNAEYRENTLENPFYGVYCGQAALPFEPDTIVYLTNELTDNYKVTSYDTGMPAAGEVYDMEAAFGKDPYEMFVCGADALVTIENPNAETDRELVVFRDSFGSSIAPLLCESYAKVTLVDIRYVQSDMLGSFVDFEACDVLFLYSTLVLNNSSMFK